MGARDLLAALAVVIIWGLNFIAMKWGLESFTPFELGAMRYVAAALPMVFLVRPPRIGWRWVVGFGMFQGVGQFSFGFFALKLGMTAALASVLMQTQVFFTALFGFGVLHERPGRPLVLGLALALAGVGLLCFAMNHLQPGGLRPTGLRGVVLPGAHSCLCGAGSHYRARCRALVARRRLGRAAGGGLGLRGLPRLDGHHSWLRLVDAALDAPPRQPRGAL